METEIISIENIEKLEEELKQEKSKSVYWKNEHFQLSLKNKELKKIIKQLNEENSALKKIINDFNRGVNE